MDHNNDIDDMLALLMQYDASWYQVPNFKHEVVLRNYAGQEIHAPSLHSAVIGALALVGIVYDTYGD